jgi:creatinine amidohydrolase
MPLELAKISIFQLDSLSRSKTVFYFPVGPLEDHGPHLPLGLDLEEADRLCYLAAQHLEEEMPGWSGVIMPKAPLGIDSNTSRIAITVRPHVLRDWLVDACRSLRKAGFYHFVCFSGQLGPKQLTAIEEAGIRIARTARWNRMSRLLLALGDPRPTLVSASSATVKFKDVCKSPFRSDPEEHGGKRDTSVALAILPDQVDVSYSSLPDLSREPSSWIRHWKFRRGRLFGYWGSPADANRAHGENEMLQVLERVFPKLRAVWEGANPNSLFRSWYSILPPNKSFFKAWVLALTVIALFIVWEYLNRMSY